MVKSPALKDPITSPFTVNVEISGDLANNYTSSDSVTFTYLPLEKLSKANDSTISLEAYQETLELSGILREIAGLSPESTYVLDMGIDALSKGTYERKLLNVGNDFDTRETLRHMTIRLKWKSSFSHRIWSPGL